MFPVAARGLSADDNFLRGLRAVPRARRFDSETSRGRGLRSSRSACARRRGPRETLAILVGGTLLRRVGMAPADRRLLGRALGRDLGAGGGAGRRRVRPTGSWKLHCGRDVRQSDGWLHGVAGCLGNHRGGIAGAVLRRSPRSRLVVGARRRRLLRREARQTRCRRGRRCRPGTRLDRHLAAVIIRRTRRVRRRHFPEHLRRYRDEAVAQTDARQQQQQRPCVRRITRGRPDEAPLDGRHGVVLPRTRIRGSQDEWIRSNRGCEREDGDSASGIFERLSMTDAARTSRNSTKRPFEGRSLH